MILPEIILQDLVQKLVKITAADWNDPAVKNSRKLLNQLFLKDDNDNDLKIDNFSYLEGAKAIFLNTAGQSRRLFFPTRLPLR